MAPGDLAQALCGLDIPTNEHVLIGLAKADDAGVYKITDNIALIQTVDFFTPIVDDPRVFGQIAAANALSDVYAMGGVPKTALNLVAFPTQKMDFQVLREILEGGLEKLTEAGVVLLGGHSIDDPELKYGLSVTGTIHPDRVLAKGGLLSGDCLLVTKPLGTGVVSTAIKAGIATELEIEEATRWMTTLNKTAADIMSRHDVHACTDITGFGLIGHLAEMVSHSDMGVVVESGQLATLSGAREYAQMGLLPAGAHNNRSFRSNMVDISDTALRENVDLLFDPQTSGGLLMSVSEKEADALLQELRNAPETTESFCIGRVSKDHPNRIEIRE